MRIHRLVVQDFLSIHDEKVELNSPLGLVLIEGRNRDDPSAISNGAGKSALIGEALFWVFYGKTLRGGKGDEVIRKDAAFAHVLVHVTAADGHTYEIGRCQGNISLGMFPIYIRRSGDGAWVDITPASKREGHQRVLDIVGIPPEVFSSILILGEGFENRFAGFTDKAKAEFIEELIDLAELDEAQKRARSQVRDMAASSGNMRQQIEMLEQQGQRLEEHHKAEVARWEHSLTGFRERLKTAEAQLAEAQDAATAAPAPDPGHLEHVRRQSNDGQAELVGAQGQLTYWRNQRANAKRLRPDTQCPTCLQNIPASHIDDTVLSMEVEIEAQEGVVTGLQQQVDALRNQFQQLQEAQSRALGAQQRLNQATHAFKQVREALAQLEQQAPTAPRIDDVSGQVEHLRRQLAEIDNEAPYVEFWVKGFSHEGLRSYRTDSVLSWLNDRLWFYCMILYDGAVSVWLNPERELKSGRTKNAITIEATLPGGSYVMASRGERRKVDLALHMALQDLAIRVAGFQLNLLVADEVLDSLDAEAQERAIKVLDERAAEVGTVFLITHEEGLRSKVATTWTVVKEGGASRVER